MYKSYSYSNMPEPVNTHTPSHHSDHPVKREHEYTHKSSQSIAQQHNNNAPAKPSLQNDDIILIIIVAILLINGCDDKLLIIALAYIFFSGYNEKGGSITELLQ